MFNHYLERETLKITENLKVYDTKFFLFLITCYGPTDGFVLIDLPVCLCCELVDILMTIASHDLLENLSITFD